MKIDYPVPFYKNTPDDTHCFQAVLKMILKYFWPEEEYTWKELEKITAKVEGLWTWPSAGLIWLQEKGLEIKNIELFDYEKFIQQGGAYLIEEYGEDVGNVQIRNSDIAQEIELAKKFIKVIDIKKEIPKEEDIKKFLTKGYLVGANINSALLNKKEGYAGHFVMVKGFNNKGFIIHDPGLPGLENRKVEYGLFEKAWAYPNKKAKNIMAFKLKK